MKALASVTERIQLYHPTRCTCETTNAQFDAFLFDYEGLVQFPATRKLVVDTDDGGQVGQQGAQMGQQGAVEECCCNLRLSPGEFYTGEYKVQICFP